MDRFKQHVVGDKCIRNDAGELPLSDRKKLEAWRNTSQAYLMLNLIGLLKRSTVKM